MDHDFVGISAAVVSAVAYTVYGFSIFFGDTKPNRAAWFIWSVVALICCFSYHETTTSRTAWWISISYAVGSLTIFILTLKWGEGGVDKLDLSCLVGSIFGALLWWMFNSPLTALLINILMDCLGAIPTIQKAWHKPKKESLIAWTLSTLAGVINLFAVKEWAWDAFLSEALYPVYAAACIGTVWVVLIIRRLQKIQ